MPVAINTSRPPSATNVPNGPNGAPRTTATSRRGGRTRSRSPPVMGGRMTVTGSDQFPPVVGDNPSSAAAAAAAAAKAYSTRPAGRPPHAAWPEGGREEQPYHGYDKHYHHGSSTNWSSGDDSRTSYRYQGDYQGYPSGHYRDDRYHDSRYRDSRGTYYDDRGPPAPPSSRGPYPVDYRYSHGRESRSNPPGPRAGNGGTSLVIGGATPIHVPKLSSGDQIEHRSDSHASSRHSSRRGTLDSVFRGRPGDVAPAPAGSMDESPQKILLSLRTPSASFEEKDATGQKKDPLLTEKPNDVQVNDRSPEDSKNSGSIETAPSFSLFNQSFDSFGDGHYFNVDSTLQNDSFGMGRIASVDPDAATQILRTTSANFSQQLLATNSGALTLDYSPVNSFGNVSAAGPSRRSGNTMVVGGPELSSSPTHDLNFYRSHSNSGGAPRSGPLDDSHLRMSVGSFGLGVASMPYSRSYGEGPVRAPSYYYGPGRMLEASAGSPMFYSFLAKYRTAFEDCYFLLPGLKAALFESAFPKKDDAATLVASETGNAKSMFGEPSPQEVEIARRRVESSIFAFGGNPNSRDLISKNQQALEKSSIFRTTNEATEKKQSATVTPGSTASQKDNVHLVQLRPKSRYEEELPGRYYENESRLSWEFEESPPIEIRQDMDDGEDDIDDSDSAKKAYAQSNSKGHEGTNESVDGKSESNDGEKLSSSTPSSPQPKMRYRCKLCGQPKQNHTCPFQQSLARNIGIMVFPAVNAFAANEPGTLAPPLTEMNNFVDTREPGSNDSSPGRPSPDRSRSRVPSMAPVSSTTQVTPESMKSSPRTNIQSPSSYVALRTPSRHATPSRHPMNSGKKRSFTALNGNEEEKDLLFMESLELKIEQFRVVTPCKALNAPDAFSYPSLPLPYAQRKRLSDNLFALSNEVPKLTDECAQVLREAREKDMWDLAVAELMTQVIVIIHCADGDACFEGLRQYLLTLGIAC